MKRSLRYRILLPLVRALPVKKLMASPPEKLQRFFRRAYKGARIPKLEVPGLVFSRMDAAGSAVLAIRHREPVRGAGIYLIGGGMLKSPRPANARECASLAKACGIDMFLPYYPVVFDGATLPDVYETVYQLYKQVLKDYRAEDVRLMGGSSGGNLALGLISYIREKGEGLPMPGKLYAGSPGTLLLTDAERALARKLEKTDVIMSVRATERIWEGMTGGKEVPLYMRYLQLGDYTGLKDAYLSFGGDEVFLAGAESIKARLESCGVHVTMETGEGMYHSYAMMPVVKDAEDGYRRFRRYIA